MTTLTNKGRKQNIIDYIGNKYDETKIIKDIIDWNKYDVIIEPFCGSFGFSRYIVWNNMADLNKKKFIFMDINKDLINFYNEIKKMKINEIKEIIDKYNEFVDFVYEKFKCNHQNNYIYLDRKKVDKYISGMKDTFFKKIIIYNYSTSGFCRIVRKKNIFDSINMIRHKNVMFVCDSYLNIDKHLPKNGKVLMYLDPPYYNSSVNKTAYDVDVSDLYEIFKKINEDLNDKRKYDSILVHKGDILMELLWDKHKKFEFNKTYQITKKKVKHIVFGNFLKK